MNKKLLKAIPFNEPKPAWIDLTKQAPNKQYYIAAQIKMIDHHKTLILDFYDTYNLLEKQKPTYRVFLINNDYLTLIHKDNKIKWLTGSVSYLLGWNWHSHCIIADITSHDTICRFFHYCENPFQTIDKHQDTIKAKRLAATHKKECQLIDTQMQAIRPLPKGFVKWVEEDTLPHYIYYVYKKRKTLDGYCTHCHQDVQVTDARHNKSGICPGCGKTIIYKAVSRSKNIVDISKAVYFQKTSDGFIIRYFRVHKSYREQYRSPKLTIYECFRDFYSAKATTPKCFCFASFKGHGAKRWCNDNGKILFDTFIYPATIKSVLNDTLWQYSGIDCFADFGKKLTSVYHYMKVYPQTPALEYLVKAKLFGLANYFATEQHFFLVNAKAHSLTELLQVNKYYLKKMINLDISFPDLTIFQKLTRKNLLLNDQQIKFILTHFEPYNVDTFIKLLSITKKLTKTISYLQKTAQKENCRVLYAANEWLDYLSMCSKMEYDLNLLSLLYPRNLKEEHDRVTQLFKLEESEVNDMQLAKMYPQIIEHYGYETDQFFIAAPKSQADLINESAALGHCVKDYVSRIVDQECIIIFLRRKSAPQTPYYTLEIRQNRIVQCETKNHKSPEEINDQPVLDFLEEYERTVLKNQTQIAA